jgi:hypothetical protein
MVDLHLSTGLCPLHRPIIIDSLGVFVRNRGRMKSPATILFSLSAVLLVAFATPASANLVTNGGFETGDFTGWFHAGNTITDSVGGPGNSGAFSAVLGPVATTASLSQTLSTTSGAFYDLSFFLANSAGGNRTNVGGAPVDFRIIWNGVQIFDASLTPPGTFTPYNFLVQATGAATALEFVYRNDPGFFFLDDISVEPHQAAAGVPETGSSVLLMGLTLVGLFGARRVFDVQRATGRMA